jgi:hypothetical protein
MLKRLIPSPARGTAMRENSSNTIFDPGAQHVLADQLNQLTNTHTHVGGTHWAIWVSWHLCFVCDAAWACGSPQLCGAGSRRYVHVLVPNVIAMFAMFAMLWGYGWKHLSVFALSYTLAQKSCTQVSVHVGFCCFATCAVDSFRDASLGICKIHPLTASSCAPVRTRLLILDDYDRCPVFMIFQLTHL